jgi:type II secretory pathway pseudopilin PulG
MRGRTHIERGITILEIMIVLAIVGLMMLIGLPMVRSMVKTDLRKDASSVAAALRGAYEMAAMSGVHHRVLFDLEAQTFQIQACPEEMRLKADDEEKLVDAAVLDKVPKPQVAQLGVGAAEVVEAESPEDAIKAAAALAGIQIGGARCVVPTTPNGDADGRGNLRELMRERGIKFGEVHAQHLREPASRGQVAINFFPLGWAEKAIVELVTDDRDKFIVVVHGLTGRVEVKDGDFDADRHMRRDAAGDEQERER